MNEPTFKKLYYLCVQKLTNFPYIEENFDALTNYELLCKVVEELNKMIDNMNTQNESIIALYNAFNTIKNYVDNYFENLDVQEEINNKLDEMASSGELTTLIENYINPYIDEQNENIRELSELIENNTLEINSLSSRMDTFTNLPDGSTSGDAELADIRVAFDGQTYSNAGNAVRGQAKNNYLSISALVDGENIPKGNFINGQVSSAGYAQNTRRVCTEKPIIYPYEVRIPTSKTIGERTYTYTCTGWTDEERTTYKALTTMTGAYIIPANQYFDISISRDDSPTLADINTFKNSLSFSSIYQAKNKYLENEININKANINKTIQSNNYTLTNVGEYITENIINASTLAPYNVSSGGHIEYENPTIGGILHIVGKSQSNNVGYPACFMLDENNKWITSFNAEEGSLLETDIVVPVGTKKVIINYSGGTPVCQTKVYSSDVIINKYPLNIADALVREAKKNPFEFSSFNKGYLTFIFDDLRDDIDLVASIFAEYNYKLCVAAIPSRLLNVCTGLNNPSQGYTVGMTAKEVCDRIVTLGGEVLSHNGPVITEELQYDYDFMYNYFINTKNELENNGYKVRGLIRAGGEGSVSHTPEIEKWLIGNYEYSNQGTAINYNLVRGDLTDNLSSLESTILQKMSNNEWLILYGHQLGHEITEANLRTLLAWCVSNNIEVVSFADIFDNFSSSQFLNSI